jgi:hypothetical protein
MSFGDVRAVIVTPGREQSVSRDFLPTVAGEIRVAFQQDLNRFGASAV